MRELKAHLCTNKTNEKSKLIAEWSEIKITEAHAFRWSNIRELESLVDPLREARHFPS